MSSIEELEKRIKKLEEEIKELRRILFEHIKRHEGIPPYGPGPTGPPDVPGPMNRHDKDVGETWRV